MQPGLPRAVPLGIVGFALGALLAIVIRAIQGLNATDPNGYVGPAMVLGAFICSGFFVWGMGAFDPRMSVHGEHAPVEPVEKVETPASILRGYTWQVAFWTLVIALAIVAFAFVPFGPAVHNVGANEGNVTAIGFVQLGSIYTAVHDFINTATGITIPSISDDLANVQVSYLVLFIIFFAWTIFSLFLVAGLISFLFTYLLRGRKNPGAVGIPWRPIIFIVLVASLLGLPLLVPSLTVPLAILMPAYVLVQLILFIVYRKAIWLILLIIALPLPVLVPNVSLSQMPNAMFALVGAAILIGAFAIIRHALPMRLGRIVSFTAYAIISIAIIVTTISATRSDFWQLWFLLFMDIVALGLVLPVDFLKWVISPSVWDSFGAIDWPMVIPRFAGWLANVLRHGLPAFLGQR